MPTYFPAIGAPVIRRGERDRIRRSDLTPALSSRRLAVRRRGVSNPLVAPWTGPYGGVPPWDQAKPELFPGAFEAASRAARRDRRDRRGSRRADFREHDRRHAALRADAGPRRTAVRRDARQHEHARVFRRWTASGSRSLPRQRTRSRSTRACSSASRRCTSRCRTANLTPEQQRLLAHLRQLRAAWVRG